jgi:3-oxoacyl-[acyl-carrier protein] reductase
VAEVRANDSRVAIVTGASSGIGEATALRLARDGWRVSLAARRADALDRVAGQITTGGGAALPVPTDVRDRAAIGRMLDATLERWGRVDLLVNNAGLSYDTILTRMDPDLLRDEVSTNLVAVIECARAVLPAMIAQRSGHIINVASLAGLVGLPTGSVYSATKFGVVGFSEALGREARRKGVHVTALCPGFVATPFSPDLQAIAEGRKPDRPHPGTMPVGYVADRIAWLARHPRRLDIIPRSWRMLVIIARVLPGLADFGLARFR